MEVSAPGNAETVEQKPSIGEETRRLIGTLFTTTSDDEHSHLSDADAPSKPQSPRRRSSMSLWERLFVTARTVTMEPKYHVHPCIAEFYCTISSPFFGLAALLWVFPPPGISPHETIRSIFPTTQWFQEFWELWGWHADTHVPPSLLISPWSFVAPLVQFFTGTTTFTDVDEVNALPLPPLSHFCIAFSLLTACASTLYHQCLYRLYSTLDCAVATIMCYLVAVQIWSPFLREYYHLWQYDVVVKHYAHVAVDFDVVLFLATLFLVFIPLTGMFITYWERHTASLTVKTMAAVFPVIAWGLAKSHSWGAIVSGLTGVGCFVLDRKRLLPVHTLWHFFGGLFVWWSIWRSIEVEERVRRLYG
jgi:hypothetical protein